MRLLIRFVIVLIVLAVVGGASYRPLARYWKERNRPNFRLTKTSRGPIRSVVNATGTIKPKLSVQIGAFVSGPIVKLPVKFNQDVKEGDILAEIDPRLYEAAVSRDEAALATRKAEVERVDALLKQAERDERRALNLYAEDEDFISDTELDKVRFNRLSLAAQKLVAEAAVKQAEANLFNSATNLSYTKIRAPSDGKVIDRKIDPGQTLAAQFQTPELFVIAPDMEKEMHVYASVDEADIGLIRDAQQRDQPVQFRVDAYPDELFEGKIKEIRLSSAETQNVVTYPVVVTAPNPDLKLLPGMTANISFLIEERENVLRVPNSALRFYPKPELVHPDDRSILEGAERASDDETDEQQPDVMVSAMERVEASRQRNKRHVWIVEGDFLRAVELITGLSENKYTEVVHGDLKDGQQLVTGIKPKTGRP